MAAVDAVVLVRLRRARRFRAWLAACACGGLAAILLAVGLAGAASLSGFAMFRLVAYGLFLHGPIVLAGLAVLLWPAQRKTAITSAALGVLVVGIAVDAFLIEPTWLEVTHLRLEAAALKRPVRVVVLADLQTDVFTAYEREVLRRTLDEKPDLILLAGDYLQVTGERFITLRGQLNAHLRQIGFSAPMGVFAIQGNVDRGGWTKTFERLPITVVRSTRSFDLGDLRLTCLSKRDSLNTSLELAGGDPDEYHVVLGHSPNYALGRIEADLLVAGHTHGGQVRLPLFGPPVTLSKVPRRWAAGLTELPSGARLLVSRGVGMERGGAPRLRLLCRPQLVVIELVPP